MNNDHEPYEKLTEKTRDYTRALNSMMEEIEAVDWYQQRMDICNDQQLKKILKHNRNEEMEHAIMLLEWLRRNMDGWDEQINTYLNTSADITNVESLKK